MHYSILVLFLILAVISISVFVYVFLTSKSNDNQSTGMANALQKRFWFILILLVILCIFASVTIPKSPYYQFADKQPSKVIHVAAQQFNFIMSNNAIDPKSPVGDASITVDANELVEFRVTSLDVNHGFAIYDPAFKLIAQTQAMPGYINRLRYQFKEPGLYHILCLEYCGMAHQVMRSYFTVK